MEEFGKSKEKWLKIFLQLTNGILSHDTFNHVFSAMSSEELENCFVEWMRSVAGLCAYEAIAIDGKSLCGSRNVGDKSIVLMVSA